jgi:hypothetical protein
MDKLLIAIRNVLIGDATLIALVPAVDILTEFTEKAVNYPRVAISITEMSRAGYPDGVARCVVGIDIWNQTNKLTNWQIHNRIKTLLHRKETTITDSDVAIHAIESAGVQGGNHLISTRTWKMNTAYVVIAEEL